LDTRARALPQEVGQSLAEQRNSSSYNSGKRKSSQRFSGRNTLPTPPLL